MKIISITAENVKKLVAVEITPDSNLVQITGKNGQGKTSVLDAIWWALAGASHIQAAPIRQGAKEARIRLDLGELVVNRTFKTTPEGEVNTAITVETAEGARFSSPQKILDGLLGALSFDPLAFTRMDPRQQFDTLRPFVPGVDFDEIDRANKRDFAARTDVNRQAKSTAAAAEAIRIPDDTPEAPIDETALLAEMEQAGQHNAELEARKARRANAEREAGVADQEAASLAQQVLQMEQQIQAMKATAESERIRAEHLRQKLAEAPPLPDPIATSEITARLVQAKEANRHVEAQQRRQTLLVQALEHEKAAAALTARMAERQAAAAKATAEAKMPIDGLLLADGQVTLNGLPFGQASDAEQLRASIAIAAAMNPKLRVIRVRDGSLLDEDALALLGEMAESQDMQVWIERVDGSGKVGIVLEAGQVKGAPLPEPLQERGRKRSTATPEAATESAPTEGALL